MAGFVGAYLMRKPLYIISPGARLSYHSGRLNIQIPTTDNQYASHSYPVRTISSIVIYGPSSFSPTTLEVLLRLKVACHVFSSSGRFIAHLSGADNPSPIKAARYALLARSNRGSQGMGCLLVREKIKAMMQFARTLDRNYPERAPSLVIESIALWQQLCRSLDALESSIEQMRGIEGCATRAHYKIMNAAVLRERALFCFLNRSRRPPRDLMNAVLSFVYSLLLNEVLSPIFDRGLPVTIGFLHSSISKNKPALALDLMEPFRVILCDRFAMRLVNLGMIGAEHFEVSEGGTYLSKLGRSVVTREWLSCLNRTRQSTGTSVRRDILDWVVIFDEKVDEQCRLVGIDI